MVLARVSIMSVLLAVTMISVSACNKSKKSSPGGGGGGAQPVNPVDTLPPPIEQNNVEMPVGLPPGAASPAAVPRFSSGRKDGLWRLGQAGLANMANVCVPTSRGAPRQAGSVSHYYIPPGSVSGSYRCKNGFGYFNQPLLRSTCLHPCRTLAADPRFHRPGEVLFFPALVGLKCGSGANEMIHDGFMVVGDNGNPEAINTEGRFGFYWGRCFSDQNGFCRDPGATAVDFALTYSPYCRAWRPQDPLKNTDVKLLIYNQVRSEAIRRGDNHAANFDLDIFIGLGVDPGGMIFRRSSN